MARHIQEKLKSLIHEVQHTIQVREGFAVGESPDNENRNQSAGEIEDDDVKTRQSMSKEERLNTFPERMKPNQNADIVFWENGKCTNKTKFSLKDNSDNENSNIDEKDVAAIQSIGRKSVNDFATEDIEKTRKIAKIYNSEMKEKSPFFRGWFGDWRANDITPIKKTKLSNDVVLPGANIINNDTGIGAFLGSQLKRETISHAKGKKSESLRLKMLNNSEELFKNAILLDTYAAPPTGNKSKKSLFMHSFYGITVDGNIPYLYKMFIEEYLNNGEVMRRGYEIKDIKTKPVSSSGFDVNASFSRPEHTGYTNIISTSSKNVNSGKGLSSLIADVNTVSDLFNFEKK